MVSRQILLAGVVFLATGTVAIAQDASSSGGLETVTVTAERRTENLQKVSGDIATVDGSQLLASGITDANQLNKLVPDLHIENNGGGANAIFLRGVGSTVSNAYGDPAISFSVDGVPFSRQYGPDTSLYDVSRIEVLKGPQGTLYGRNSTGGAINVITNHPNFDGYSGYANIEVGNYSEFRSEAAVNLPISDQWAARFAFTSNYHDGYFSDGFGDSDMYAGRAEVLFQPNDKLSVLFTADYAKEGGTGPGYVPHDGGFVDPNDPFKGPSTSAVLTYELSKGQITPASIDFHPNVDNQLWHVSAELNADLGFGELTVLPAYRHTNADDIIYLGAPLQDTHDEANQTSVEARLASHEGGRFQWLVGGFYLQEDQDFRGAFQGTHGTGVGAEIISWPNVQDKTYALFSQDSFALTDNFRVVGGIRYTHEEKTNTGGTYTVTNDPTSCIIFIPFPPPGSCVLYPVPAGTEVSNGDQKFNNVSYRGGLEYDLTDSVMLYGNVSTGFHAGGLNPGSSTDTYAPERLMSYTVGEKARFFDDTLQINAEAFLWKYHNLQVQGLGAVTGPGGAAENGLITSNAGAATLEGVDLSVLWAPTANDLVTVNALYEDTNYDDYVFYETITTTFGLIKIPAIATGNSMANAPKWSATIGYSHTFDFDNGGKLIPSLNEKLESGFFTYATHDLGTYQSGSTRTDLTLTYQFPNGHWSISAYGRNLENRAVISTALVDDPTTNGTFVTLDPPRTFGAILGVNF